MSAQFITNQKKLLSQIINNILPSSKNLYFLVGYFYFSGFEEIYKNVIDKNVNILVGLEIEKGFLNKVKEFEIIQEIEGYNSKKDIRINYYKSFVDLCNSTDYFDTKEKQEAFKIYLEKIKNGTLEIRKTINPNHAKLYLFENKEEFSQGGEFPGTVITGSSNLTRRGLKNQSEINVIFRDDSYIEAKKIFDGLWEDSVEIASKANYDEFLNEVIENIWIDKLPKPFLLYVRVLTEFFSLKKKENVKLPAEITKDRFLNLKYQIDAIQQSLDIVRRHDGVIIADVVGLGKSIIASAVANNLGLKTIIICPPHLIDQWDSDYRYNFDFNAKVYGSGSIEKALEDETDDEEKLIIVDEAHKYRNEKTKDYANLHRLCQGSKVILLTATPFNNAPKDIFSMIKLFQIPAKSTIQTVSNLSYSFRKIAKEYNAIRKEQREKTQAEVTINRKLKTIANKIRDLISPIVIRRSRIDLESIDEYRRDLENQNISFPKVNEPEILEYELGELSDLYIETFERIAPRDKSEGFIGARYKPTHYLKNREKYRKQIEKEFGDTNLFFQSQINLAGFMKRLLIYRFESSIYAFEKSLNSMIKSAEIVKDWYCRLNKVPIYKRGNLPDVYTILQSTNDYIDNELNPQTFDDLLKEYKEKGLQVIEAKELKKSFIEDVQKDIALLTEIRDKWFDSDGRKDPKTDYFINLIKNQLRKDPDRKIIVYTEFADTAEYLYKKLNGTLRAFRYTSKYSTATNKKIIKENFDAGAPNKKNDFDILIATDAISEGYNLHRAGTVFNYDIPYNPTRVIQRVGRINRINKKVFDELFIYNFFPTATGESETRIKQISTLKIMMINFVLGEDTKVLTSEEELRSFYKNDFKKAMSSQEEKSWDVSYINLLNNLKASNKEIISEALKIKKRTRIRRTEPKDIKGVIIFGKKGEDYIFKIGARKDDCKQISPEDSLKLFEADIAERSEKVSNSFDSVYQNVKKNLFIKKGEVPKDRSVIDVINKIEVIIKKLPEIRDYLNDLLFVIEKLDGLTENDAKQIRAINSKTLNEDIEKLKKDIPHKYLLGIIKKAKKIDEGEETLILSEELI